MADLSITKAHELIPYPFGLLSVASVSEYTSKEGSWARYTAHELNSKAFALRNISGYNEDTAVELHDSTIDGTYVSRFLEYYPFGIEVEDYASALGINSQDRFDRVKKILAAATSKAVERELWEGDAAQADTNGNGYLTETGKATTVSVTAGGDVPRLALARLEGALSSCPSGLKGTIHMTRKMASILYDYLERVDYSSKLDRDDITEKGYGSGQILVTRLGTPVVVGAGYTGNGPDGATGASATNTTEWMFATGYCDVHLGAIEVVNEDLARSFTVSSNTNDARIKALRSAAVHFENCCHYAARVDYSASV